MTVHFALHFSSVVALDVTKEFVADCVKELNERAIRNVELVVGSVEALSGFSDGSFDSIVSYLTLQHISQMTVVDAYIRQAARLLSDNGVAALQMRRPEMWARAIDLCGWTFRLAQGMSTFHKCWRGTRPTSEWLRTLPALLPENIDVTYRYQSRHLWVVLTANGLNSID